MDGPIEKTIKEYPGNSREYEIEVPFFSGNQKKEKGTQGRRNREPQQQDGKEETGCPAKDHGHAPLGHLTGWFFLDFLKWVRRTTSIFAQQFLQKL